MCGWSLLWRWIVLSHSQQAFSRTLSEFQGLSDDRKRIISRVLDKSTHAWARTQADPGLQQAAHTIRQAFLVHLFQFNTSVHTRLDALSICAAGQPLWVFEHPQQDERSTLTVATQTQDAAEETRTNSSSTALANLRVQTGVQTEFFGEETSNMTISQCGPGWERTRARVQEFCIYPALAGSDELDHAIDICRHFTGPVNLLPCCMWLPDRQIMEVISNRRCILTHHLEHRVLIMAHHHWFAVHILFDAGLVWVHIYGFPNSNHDAVPGFLRALADFLHIQTHQIRAHLFPYECPEAMCGFKMLQGCFDAMDIAFTPSCEGSVHALQAHQWAEDFAYIGNHAVRMWRQASQDHVLVKFAFSVRTLFMAHLLQTQWVERHVRGGGPEASWSPGQSLPTLKPDTRKSLQDHVRAHCPVADLCTCRTKAFSAQAITGTHAQKWNGMELVTCRIVPPATGLSHMIGDMNCSWPECTHPRVTFAHLSMPSHLWKMLGPDRHIFIVEARLLWIDHQCIIDIRAPQAGIVPINREACTEEQQIRVGEFFGGGFSGWSFAAKMLADSLLPAKQVFSIEHDIIAAKVHATNHSNFPPITSVEQAIDLGAGGEPPKEHLMVVANIEHSWWCHLFEQVDILVASPPCQPWSRAGAERGLDAEEGRLLIYTVTQCIYLRPAVLCLEEVASVLAHQHAPWILAFIHWAGYEIVWKANLNLSEVLPQSRTRLMLVAVRIGDPRVKQMPSGTWTKAHLTPTLQSIILPDSDASHEFTPTPSPDIFDMYFQPRYLPQGVGTTSYQIRKCRVKTIADVHPCLMASYSKSHELPTETLSQKGLLGAFVLHNGKIRLLSIAEAALLFGSAHPVYMPCNHRIAYHLLGNAIAVPHALLGLINGIAQLASIGWSEIPKWILDELMNNRLRAPDVSTRVVPEHDMLIIERNPVSPTASWEVETHHFNALRITQGRTTVVIRVMQEVRVMEALRKFYRLPLNTHLTWQPRGDAKTVLPLFFEDTTPSEGMQILNFDTGPLTLEEHMFKSKSAASICVLTPSGPFLMTRSKVGNIGEVIDALNPHFQQVLVGQDHLGWTLGLELEPPDVLFVVPEVTPAEIDHVKLMRHTWVLAIDRAINDMSMHDALWILHQFTLMGWTDIVRALGWKTVLDTHPGSGITSPKQVQLSLQRCRNASGVTLQALINVLITRLTIRLLEGEVKHLDEGPPVRVKLWESIIWEGRISPETLSGVFATTWSRAASFFGMTRELRTLVHGQRTNPEWSIRHYINTDPAPQKPHTIQLIMQIEGGGSKAEAAVKLKEDFTARLLQLGFDPIDTRQFVTQLYQEAGAARLRHMLAMQDEEAFIQQNTLLAQQTRTKLPERHDLEADRNKKVRLQWKSFGVEPSSLNPADLKIEPGTFCRADNSEVTMQTRSGPQEPGIVFIDAADIVAFAKKTRESPPAEILAIVPGTQCPLRDPSCNRLNLQVRTRSDEKVIIAACCHSIGKNPIQQKVSPGDGAKVSESTKAMFVVWRQECPEETWSQLIDAPIQTVFKTLQIIPSEAIAGAPVGRSWRANRQATDPQEADSFCFYARILASMLTSVLKQSGVDGIYVTPKSEHSTLADSRFNVIWTDAHSSEQAFKQIEKLDCALGIIRTSKDRPTYGVRVWAKDFDTAWNLLKPGEPKPKQFAGEYLYKVSPLPEGVTAEDIQAWIALEKLPAKPLRALSASTWLLIGQEKIDRQHLTWKRNAIMLKPLDSKYSRNTQTILAASSQPSKTRRTWKTDRKESEPIDPLSVSDPWAQARENMWSNDPWWPSPSITNASSASSRSDTTRCSDRGNREQQQEIDTMKHQISALEKAVNQQNKDTAGLRKEVHHEFAAVRKEVTEVKTSFQTTLTAALGQTQEVLQRGFKEDFESLKALLTGTSRKRGERDEDMEG